MFPTGNAPAHPVPRIKQHGALLAKGRLLGVQFEALFTDGLYLQIGKAGIDTAHKLRRFLHEHGARFLLESPTNQQMVIVSKADYERLQQHMPVSYWDAFDEDHVSIRLATSWASTDADIEELATFW